MIEEGTGWKFRQHIEDNGLFEDQIVEHMGTGHLAVRRVFSKKLDQENEALEAVKEQVTCSKDLHHPAVQRIFFMEEVEGHLCLYGEHMDGTTLDVLTRHKTFQDRSKWVDAALAITTMLSEFQQANVAFDRLTLHSIRVKGNVVRVVSRWPTGTIRPGEEPESRFFRRLLELPVGGVYVARRGYPLEAGLERVKELLFFMATAKDLQSVAQVLEEREQRKRDSGAIGVSPLGLDSDIEQIILGLHESTGPNGIRSIEQLKSALAKLVGRKPRKAAPAPQFASAEVAVKRVSEESAPSPKRAAPAPDPIKGPKPPPPTAVPQQVAKPAPPVEPDPVSDPMPPRQAASASAPSSVNELGMLGRHTDDDADEDRAYLYPTPSSDKVPSKKAASGLKDERMSSSSTPSPDPSTVSADSATDADLPIPDKKKKKRRAGGGFKVKIPLSLILVPIGIAAVAGIAFFAWDFFKPHPQNERPVGQITQLPESVPVYTDLGLDASASYDADGDTLSFTWDIPEADPADYKLRMVDGTGDAKATIQFFRPGLYTIRLQVFDGQAMAPAVSQKIQAVPQNNGTQ